MLQLDQIIAPASQNQVLNNGVNGPQLNYAAYNNSKVGEINEKGAQQEVLDLNQSNLGKLAGRGISLPSYNRQDMGESWVHVGVGAFHRAHQAFYQNLLFNKLGADEWGICGMSLLEDDTFIRDVLAKQDNLYTVLERTPQKDEATVIGSIKNFMLIPEVLSESIQKLADESTKLVTFTVTESGYAVNQDTGDLDIKHPNVEHDLKNKDSCPKSVFGLLELALRARMNKGLPPFTMLSCDNVFHNGEVFRKNLLTFLSFRDPELKSWVQENGTFPCTMVDRITPTFAKEVKDTTLNNYGVNDLWPVATEPFTQWVVEDNFPLGRPAWEEVGVQLVPNVFSYEKLKLSVLNVFQLTVSIYCKICAYTYMHEGTDDPLILELGKRIMELEVTPLLEHIDGVSFDDYKKSSIIRVQNSAIKDTSMRMAGDASGKLSKLMFPSLLQAVKIGKIDGFKYLTFTVALWCKLFTGIDEYGNDIYVLDPLAERLMISAKKGGRDPSCLLENVDIFAPILRNSEDFKNLLAKYLGDIYDLGTKKALAKLLADA